MCVTKFTSRVPACTKAASFLRWRRAFSCDVLFASRFVRGGCAVGTPPAHLGMRRFSDNAVCAKEVFAPMSHLPFISILIDAVKCSLSSAIVETSLHLKSGLSRISAIYFTRMQRFARISAMRAAGVVFWVGSGSAKGRPLWFPCRLSAHKFIRLRCSIRQRGLTAAIRRA